MKTMHVYRLNNLSPTLFRRLKAAQMEAARVWNRCMELHKEARMTHVPWPGAMDLHHLTRGRFALNAQAVQQVTRAFLGTIETTRKLRREHPEMRMKYPWRIKTFYPVKWPAQAVHREKGRVVLPMGKGHASLVLPLHLPENAGACTLVWNRGFELHVCIEIPQAEKAPGAVKATVDLGEIHLAAVTTSTGQALIVTGRGIRSLKRQRSKQLGQLAKKQSRCRKHSRRWKKLQRAKNKICRRSERRVRDLRHKPKGRNWACRKCGGRFHRDLVGSVNMHQDVFGIHLKCPRSFTYLRPGPLRTRKRSSQADTPQRCLNKSPVQPHLAEMVPLGAGHSGDGVQKPVPLKGTGVSQVEYL